VHFDELGEFTKFQSDLMLRGQGEDATLGPRRQQHQQQEQHQGYAAKEEAGGSQALHGKEVEMEMDKGRRKRSSSISSSSSSLNTKDVKETLAVADSTRSQATTEMLQRARLRRVRDLKKPREQTLSANSFSSTGAETIGLDLFKFLVSERKLKDFEILHYLHYKHKDYLNHFIKDMLQRRWDLRWTPGTEFLKKLMKLMINALYGIAAMQKTSFTVTSIVSEAYLSNQRKRLEESIYSENVRNVIFLGVVAAAAKNKQPPDAAAAAAAEEDNNAANDDNNIGRNNKMRKKKKKKKRAAQSLYSVTKAAPRSRICNVLQMSSCILSESRHIFLGLLLGLLRTMDPSKMELCYTGEKQIYFSEKR
jgi:hypothetical protein